MAIPYDVNNLIASDFFRSARDKKFSDTKKHPSSQTEYRYSYKQLHREKPKKSKVIRPTVVVEDETISLLKESSPIFPSYDPPSRGVIDQDPIIIELEDVKAEIIERLQKSSHSGEYRTHKKQVVFNIDDDDNDDDDNAYDDYDDDDDDDEGEGESYIYDNNQAHQQDELEKEARAAQYAHYTRDARAVYDDLHGAHDPRLSNQFAKDHIYDHPSDDSEDGASDDSSCYSEVVNNFYSTDDSDDYISDHLTHHHNFHKNSEQTDYSKNSQSIVRRKALVVPDGKQLNRKSSNYPNHHETRSKVTDDSSISSRESRNSHANHHARKENSLQKQLVPRYHQEADHKPFTCSPVKVKRRDPLHTSSNRQITGPYGPHDGTIPCYEPIVNHDPAKYFPETVDYRYERNPYPYQNPTPFSNDPPMDYPSGGVIDNINISNNITPSYPVENHGYPVTSSGMLYPRPNGAFDASFAAPYPYQGMPVYDTYGMPNAVPVPNPMQLVNPLPVPGSTVLTERSYPPPFQPEWQTPAYQPPSVQPTPSPTDENIHPYSRNMIKPLVKCPRTKFTKGKKDWLTLPRCPNFDICKYCFDAEIAPTEFYQFFVPSPRTNPAIEILCDFGRSPWYRIAWLTIMAKKIKNLDLFYDLAHVAMDTSPCVEDKKIIGEWWSIVDPCTGNYLPGFKICVNCVNNIQILLPALRGIFVYVEDYDAQPCACVLRSDKTRFVKFFDTFEIMAASAVSKGVRPDLRPLTSLIRSFRD